MFPIFSCCQICFSMEDPKLQSASIPGPGWLGPRHHGHCSTWKKRPGKINKKKNWRNLAWYRHPAIKMWLRQIVAWFLNEKLEKMVDFTIECIAHNQQSCHQMKLQRTAEKWTFSKEKINISLTDMILNICKMINSREFSTKWIIKV